MQLLTPAVALQIDHDAFLTGELLSELNREAVRLIELEGDLARKHPLAAVPQPSELLLDAGGAARQGLLEPAELVEELLEDLARALLEFGIGGPVGAHDLLGRARPRRRVEPDLMADAGGPT